MPYGYGGCGSPLRGPSAPTIPESSLAGRAGGGAARAVHRGVRGLTRSRGGRRALPTGDGPAGAVDVQRVDHAVLEAALRAHVVRAGGGVVDDLVDHERDLTVDAV